MRTHAPRVPTAIALLALFISLGGVAAAGTMISGASIKVRSIPGDRMKLHTIGQNAMRLPPEQVVGATGEPGFGSGWKNAGGGYQSVGFYRDDEGVVHLRGAVAFPASSITIFTLPTGYRPAATEMFSAELDDAGSAMVFVTSGGDVDLEFVNPNGSAPHAMSLSGISFRAGV
jgi:hypothetical protein